MTATRRNPTAARLADRLYRAAGVIPSIEDHLGEQRSLVITLSASRTDSSGGSKSGHSDPAARVTLELAEIDNHRTAIRDALATANIAINLLDEACRDALGHQARRDPKDTESKPRCIGDNTAAGATCWQIPAPRRDHGSNQTVDDGRCLDCGQRVDERRRAKAEHERKTRLASSSTAFPA
jgi:hypothetical protein